MKKTELCERTNLSERDVDIACMTFNLPQLTSGQEIPQQTANMLILYDLLNVLGFEERNVMIILKAIQHILMEEGFPKENEPAILQLIDNQFALLGDSLYDFVALRVPSKEEIGTPVISMAIVLNELYKRVMAG